MLTLGSSVPSQQHSQGMFPNTETCLPFSTLQLELFPDYPLRRLKLSSSRSQQRGEAKGTLGALVPMHQKVNSSLSSGSALCPLLTSVTFPVRWKRTCPRPQKAAADGGNAGGSPSSVSPFSFLQGPCLDVSMIHGTSSSPSTSSPIP